MQSSAKVDPLNSVLTTNGGQKHDGDVFSQLPLQKSLHRLLLTLQVLYFQRTTRGEPLSPLQASFSPLESPAQTTFSFIAAALVAFSRQSLRDTNFILICWSTAFGGAARSSGETWRNHERRNSYKIGNPSHSLISKVILISFKDMASNSSADRMLPRESFRVVL